MISTVMDTNRALRVERVMDDAALAALAEDWNHLAGDVPFRRHEWLATWWRHYGAPRRELFVLLVVEPSGEPVGLAPWYLSRSRWHGRTIRFLGSGEVASDYVGVLAADGRQSEVVQALARWLSSDAACRWDLIDLDGIDPDDVVTQAFAEEMELQGSLVRRRQRFQSWRLSLPEDFDAFLKGLSSSRQKRMRQLLRKHVDSGRAAMRLVEREDDVTRGIDVLRDLHQSRRNSLGEAGCFASRQFGEFHADVARRFFELGRLRLACLEYEGQPIAAEYSLIGGDTVYYYQTGFKTDFAQISPGWLAMAATLRSAIEQGFRTFDFLRGDEPYKASWGAEPRALVEFRIVANRPMARLRHAVWESGARTKRCVKRGLQLCERLRRPRASSPIEASGAQGGADQAK